MARSRGLGDVYKRQIQKYGSLTAVRAVETFAKSQLALTPDAWDADDMMLNTPGGVIDLSTGAIIEGASARDMLCTKLAGTTAAPAGSPTPLWDRFLRDVTDGNADLIAYLQRIAGYTLTGLTHEHGLMFVHGSGGNGKSVFLNVLQDVMGSYSHTAQMTTFTESKFDRHPTEIAALRGARLVTAQETEEGRYWAEAKIKELTGGTRISARFMRQDEFTFQPKFKLVIAGNHRPRLRNPDEAMKRRIHLIPFTVTIRDKDTGLQDKLRAEYPAILRWAIDGCIEWQRIGLAMPDVVRTATDEYLASEDKIRQWIAECIDTTRRDDAENKAQLYKSYKRWSEDAGHPWPMDKSRWYAALQAMGYSEMMTGSGQRVIRGLRFVESDTF
jgi:putative DNA primase/helicase